MHSSNSNSNNLGEQVNHNNNSSCSSCRSIFQTQIHFRGTRHRLWNKVQIRLQRHLHRAYSCNNSNRWRNSNNFRRLRSMQWCSKYFLCPLCKSCVNQTLRLRPSSRLNCKGILILKTSAWSSSLWCWTTETASKPAQPVVQTKLHRGLFSSRPNLSSSNLNRDLILHHNPNRITIKLEQVRMDLKFSQTTCRWLATKASSSNNFSRLIWSSRTKEDGCLLTISIWHLLVSMNTPTKATPCNKNKFTLRRSIKCYNQVISKCSNNKL